MLSAAWNKVYSVFYGDAPRGFGSKAARSLAGAAALAVALLSASVAAAGDAGTDAAGPGGAGVGEAVPNLYLCDGQALAAAKARVLAGDPAITPAVEALKRKAEEAMKMPLRSVTEKTAVPPSGDKRDYVSLSPYWWPNPDTPDGEPYVRRDGEINPERYDYDVDKLGDAGKAICWLGFGYYYTGEERYARRAAEWVRHFFLDEQTRMNPRMKYGQFVPGVAVGRHVGVIETLRLRWVPDAATLLAESDALTDEDVAGLKKWFGDYAQWIRTSELGQQELSAKNNHGTWAATQVALFSAFAGNDDATREMIERRMPNFDLQIEADGKQPAELARTRSLDYSDFNLRAYSDMAMLGQRVGVDLWHHKNAHGATLKTALEFLAPYMAGQKEWPYKQISPPKHWAYAQTLRRSAIAYDEPRFEEAIAKMPLGDDGLIYTDLILPRPSTCE